MDKIEICSFPPWDSRYCLSLRKSPNSEQDPNRRNSCRKWRILFAIRVQNNNSWNFCGANFHFSSAFCATWAQFVENISKVLFKSFSALMWGCHPSNQHPTSFLFPECWKVCRPFLVPFEFLAWSLEMWHGFMDIPILGLSSLSISSDSDHH